MIRIAKNKIIILDTETTGLPDSLVDGSLLEHEVLQLVIIDGTGLLLMNELFRPIKNIDWPEAQMIHGITPGDVQDKPVISGFISAIQYLVDSAELIVAYNLQFDLLFLRTAGVSFSGKYYYDVMYEFARKHAKSRRFGSEKFVPLKKCATYYGHKLMDAHDAEADARATLHCFLAMKG